MAGSIATTSPPPPSTQAASWVRGLGQVFRRVALFEVDGTTARIASVHGMGSPRLGTCVPLVDDTPLRWAVAAASPIIGAGNAPGGAAIAAVMGVSTPRAYAVIPLVADGRLCALAYVDHAGDPLPLSAASQLFGFCDQVLRGASEPKSPQRSSQHRSTSRRSRRLRSPGLMPAANQSALPAIDPMVEAAAQRALFDELPEEIEPELARNFSEPELAEYTLPEADDWRPEDDDFPGPVEASHEEGTATFDPAALEENEAPSYEEGPVDDTDFDLTWVENEGAPPNAVYDHDDDEHHLAKLADHQVARADGFVTPPKRRPATAAGRQRRWLAIAAGAAALAVALAVIAQLMPVDGADGHRLIQIPRNASVAQIARHLAEARVIRSPLAFRVLARVSGTDRSLRAGAYRLPAGAWAPTVLSELHQGQVHTRTITVPEGLTLTEVAKLLETEGLARATDILREAYSPDLLARFGIPASNVEGYLFPETYTLAEGLSAREILTVMLDEMRAQLADITDLEPRALHQRIILASIVEREARKPSEYARVAGVFANRLQRNMRLESCATVQYILGEPKARLTYADVRRESPFNTYLHAGLPPGPIANPGRAAVEAALLPERHDFLFFFSRENGSHTHVFSRTFAAHKDRQRQMRAAKR